MSDKELLEKAAKAAGYKWDASVSKWRAEQNPPLIALWIPEASTAWNPLEDDGHALRLAVKLGMTVRHDKTGATARRNEGDIWSGVMFKGDDHYAATRRAIVRAAAQIGETK